MICYPKKPRTDWFRSSTSRWVEKPDVAAVQKDSTLHRKIWSARSLLRFCMMNTNNLLKQLCFLVFSGWGKIHVLFIMAKDTAISIPVNASCFEDKLNMNIHWIFWLHLTKLPALVLNKLDPVLALLKGPTASVVQLCAYHGGHASVLFYSGVDGFQRKVPVSYKFYTLNSQCNNVEVFFKKKHILGKNAWRVWKDS